MTRLSVPEDFLAEILIDEHALQNRIVELGAQLTADYATLSPLLVCILRGGVMFMTDLMRQMQIPHSIDFMAVSSYDVGARISSGQTRIVMDLKTDITNRHVLLVEDIVDTGHTLAHVCGMLKARLPASLKVCTLLDKYERREVDVPIHYTGFRIPDKFVVGYGLDIDEYWRSLPYIGVVKSGVTLDVDGHFIPAKD